MFYELNLNLFHFFLTILIIPLYAFDIELTVLIPANQRECFHQVFEAGATIEVDYEVLAGGDIDINYWLYSPTNRVLRSDYKHRDSQQTLKLEESGEYRFCFDNSFSRFSQKQVYFSLRPADEPDGNSTDETTESWMSSVEKDELGELQDKIEQIKNTFDRIWNNMETAQRYQNTFKNHEGHDRILIEKKFNRINLWSIINLTLMIGVTLIQVITIRSLFETKSTYGKFLRGKK